MSLPGDYSGEPSRRETDLLFMFTLQAVSRMIRVTQFKKVRQILTLTLAECSPLPPWPWKPFRSTQLTEDVVMEDRIATGFLLAGKVRFVQLFTHPLYLDLCLSLNTKANMVTEEERSLAFQGFWMISWVCSATWVWDPWGHDWSILEAGLMPLPASPVDRVDLLKTVSIKCSLRQIKWMWSQLLLVRLIRVAMEWVNLPSQDGIETRSGYCLKHKIFPPCGSLWFLHIAVFVVGCLCSEQYWKIGMVCPFGTRGTFAYSSIEEG